MRSFSILKICIYSFKFPSIHCFSSIVCFFLNILVFIYFLLAVVGLSLVVASEGYSLVMVHNLLIASWSQGLGSGGTWV